MQNNTTSQLSIQWGISFNRPISQIFIDEQTSCKLRPIVLSGNLKNHAVGVIPEDEIGMAGEGVADQFVICTLGDLLRGEITARFSIRLNPEYSTAVMHRNMFWRGRPLPELLAWVSQIQAEIRSNRREDTDTMRLFDIMDHARRNDRNLKLMVSLAAARGIAPDEVPAELIQNYLKNEENIFHDFPKQPGKTSISVHLLHTTNVSHFPQ